MLIFMWYMTFCVLFLLFPSSYCCVNHLFTIYFCPSCVLYFFYSLQSCVTFFCFPLSFHLRLFQLILPLKCRAFDSTIFTYFHTTITFEYCIPRVQVWLFSHSAERCRHHLHWSRQRKQMKYLPNHHQLNLIGM